MMHSFLSLAGGDCLSALAAVYPLVRAAVGLCWFYYLKLELVSGVGLGLFVAHVDGGVDVHLQLVY